SHSARVGEVFAYRGRSRDQRVHISPFDGSRMRCLGWSHVRLARKRVFARRTHRFARWFLCAAPHVRRPDDRGCPRTNTHTMVVAHVRADYLYTTLYYVCMPGTCVASQVPTTRAAL